MALACPKRHLFDLDCLTEWFLRVSERKCLFCFAAAEPLVVIRKPVIDRLYDACLNDDAGVVRQILQNSPELANQSVCDHTGAVNSLFSIALRTQSRNAVLALIDHGLDVNSPVEYEFRDGGYPLHVAAAQGDVMVVAKLLGKGVAVDCLTQRVVPKRFFTNTVSRTPIGWAVRRGHCAVVKQLLDAGSAAPLFCSADGFGRNTLLCLAIDHNQVEVVRLLLLLGELGRPSLFGSSRASYINCMFFSLTHAALEGRLAIVKMLLCFCNTDSVRSRFFLYPLWYAIEFGHKEVVEVMLKAGFKNRRHHYGQSFREFAVQLGNEEIVQLIDKYGANYRVSRTEKILGTLAGIFHVGLCDDYV